MEEIQKLQNEVMSLPQEAQSILVVDVPSYERAANCLKEIKTMRKRIGETFDPIIKAAYDAHKEACAQKRKIEYPLDQAERMLKPKIATYLDAEEQKKRDREAELQAQAQKIAEEQALARAEEAEKNGNAYEAETILEEQSVAAPIILPNEVPKQEGISKKKIWKFLIKDKSKINREFLMPDEKKIMGIVKSMGKDSERLVGGIEIYQESIISAKSLY